MRTSLKMPLPALALAALWACVDSRGATGPRPPSFSRATGDGSPGALYVATNAATGNAILRSEEHTSELQSHLNLVCRLLLEKKKQHLDCAATATSTPNRHASADANPS